MNGLEARIKEYIEKSMANGNEVKSFLVTNTLTLDYQGLDFRKMQ